MVRMLEAREAYNLGLARAPFVVPGRLRVGLRCRPACLELEGRACGAGPLFAAQRVSVRMFGAKGRAWTSQFQPKVKVRP